MGNGKTFTTAVISGELLNVPDTFANHHDIRQGDTVEVQLISHKRGDEMLYDMNAEEQ